MNVLVTGASGGFGKLITKTLLDKGHKVYASMRGVDGKNSENAADLRTAGAEVVELDVTSDESVNAAISTILESGELDAVVNNAGIGVLGIQETFTPEQWQRVFDVNVFGVQRVNRAVLPHLREKGSGLLIHITSILGRMTLPFYGPYNATKWAMEALAENYRTELSGFGVDSVIVEPGGFPTGFFDSLIFPADESRNESYGELVNAPKQFFESFEGALAQNPVQDPQLVADAVLSLIETPAGERPFRTTVDKMGMGDQIDPYNDKLEEVTRGIYSAFGMDGMLNLKTKGAAAGE